VAPSDDLHQPKPLTSLLARELKGILPGLVSSLVVRVAGLTRVSYIDPRSRLIGAGNIHVGGHCQVHGGATIRAIGSRRPSVSVGTYCIIRENAYVDAHGGSVDLGEGSFVGQNSVIYGQGNVTIGANTLISPGVAVISAQHTFERVDIPIKFQPETCRGICVGSDCWLGANAVVLDGVHIGDGTVVGAGSVVTADLPSMVVAVGAPARVIRSRSR